MSALPPPPSDVSVFDGVVEQWKPLTKRAQNGEDISVEVERIESFIRDARSQLAAGELPRDLDWELDIRRAERHHANLSRWIRVNASSLDQWTSWWQERCRETSRFAVQMAHDGMKYMLAVHGAAALTALNGLISQKDSGLKVAMHVAIVGAVIGILMVGFGQIVMINILARQSVRISSALLSKRRWRTLVAIGRWQGLYFSRRLRLIDILVYGSVVWFAIYMSICLSIIVSNG